MNFQTYIEAATRVDLARYRKGDACPDLLISESGTLTVDYAPFDHIEPSAELVIVGLTPGRTQAANAMETFAGERRKGTPVNVALERAKRSASFSGAMRANLLAMLDEIGVPALFGRLHADEFFSDTQARVHFTSALRYPVYIDGKNYSGSPDPMRHPMLMRMIETHLAEEARALSQAIWVPLGRHAEAALLHLADRGHLDKKKILAGLPHPSGANAERIAYFLGRKSRERLSAKTNAVSIDAAKAKLAGQIGALSASTVSTTRE